MSSGKVANRGGGVAAVLSQAKEDVDARLDRTGCYRVWFEVRDSVTSDAIFLVVQGENNTSLLVEVLDQGTHGEENVPGEEQKFQEGTKLDCPAVICALGVFSGPDAEVEFQLDQFSDVVGLGVGGVVSCGHDGVNDSQGDSFSLLDWGILDHVGFEMPGEALVKTTVSL